MKKIYKTAAAFAAGALIVALTASTIVFHSQRESLKNQLGAVYTKAFEQLLTDVDSLKAKLYKLNASSGAGQYTMLLMDVWRQTGDTESSLSALPVSYAGTSTLTQFINRTGDYCRYLSEKLANGEALTQDDYNQIKQLAVSCGEVYDELGTMYTTGYPDENGFAEDVFLASDEEAGNLDFSNQQFPRLIYDGPFSESTENKRPEGLGGFEVAREQAVQSAAAFLGVDAETLTDAGEQNGVIPCYTFSGSNNGKSFEINVSRQGGQVLWYMCESSGGISAIPTDEKYAELTAAARHFLSQKGYGQTAASYAQFYDGMAVINLAPVQDNIVLYPDLIKVWVDIPSASVVGMDAQNYLMSHKARDLNLMTVPEDEARQALTAGIEVKGARLALIPTDTNEEKVCWEFTGSKDGQDYIIYINAQTGAQEDIFVIQHTNNGTLVM